jgi:release factor glutamine methyltransferase
LLGYVRQLPLLQKSFLELGAGSGLISIVAARQGALVTASDINPVAVEFLKKNCQRNETPMQIIHSDLFDNLPSQKFDIIAINPPYYKRQPRSETDYAWCCGENGEYFERLFDGLASYMHIQSTVLLILCDGCDQKMIQEMGDNHGFKLECVYKNQSLIEKNFIFKINYKE